MEYQDPKPGDLIWADRSVKGRPYNHCGIYEGTGTIIHFAAPEGEETNPENAYVHRISFSRFKDGCPIKVMNNIQDCLEPEETLAKARSCMRGGDHDFGGYNFATNNCDHFAMWCKTGERRSLQVEGVKAVLKSLDNPVADIACDIHDIAETFKSASIDSKLKEKKEETYAKHEMNSMFSETVQPAPEEQAEPSQSKPLEGEWHSGNEIAATASSAAADDGEEPPSGDSPPAKKRSWYEKLAEKLKGLTYPVAAALEVAKRTPFIADKFPILKKLNFPHLASKVRNVIDNVGTTIKKFLGLITTEQAAEERKNNETAFAGNIIAKNILNHPIAKRLKQACGVVGSMVKQVAQQVILRKVPAPVRNIIIAGAQAIGSKIASGVKSFAMQKASVVAGFFSKIKKKILG
jgi:hypothetical protein